MGTVYAEVVEQELVPGFEVIEHDLSHTVLKIPGGWTLSVRRMGPYTFDDLNQSPDLKDPGPFMIKVILLEGMVSPDGVEQWIEYRPPDEIPDKDEFPKEHSYYLRWRAHEADRQRRGYELLRQRMDRMLLTCVRVLDGPCDADDDGWLDDIMCTVPSEALYSHSSRRLLFLKTQVIQTDMCAELIRDLTRVEEVTVEGLRKAFDSFRSRVAG